MGFETSLLSDGFGRRFTYVRLSITEVCNFRCTYCLPEGWKKAEALSFLNPGEIANLAVGLAGAGIRKIRLTGGEPSVRRDLPEILAAIAAVPGIANVAMTTNGWNLERKAETWRTAGLTNLNVSVDALDADAFKAITGHDRLRGVLAGIDRSLELGVPSVKVNAVLLKSTAVAGFQPWADYVRDRPVAVRFIELMRTGDNTGFFAANHVPGRMVAGWLAANGWEAAERSPDGGPAQEYTHPDYAGRVGLIAPYAPGFCDACNRLRVTARGKLRLCLFGEGGEDLRDLLRDANDAGALRDRIVAALGGKAAGHRLHDGRPGDLHHLAELGG